MKTSELISILQKEIERNGDQKIIFGTDYYSEVAGLRHEDDVCFSAVRTGHYFTQDSDPETELVTKIYLK